MSCWKKYVAYLKDNPEGYWFKRKLYGYGWTPARKEGWLTLGVYLIFVLGVAFLGEQTLTAPEIITHVIAPIIGATILLIVISWRTGEPLKWQWGCKHEEK